MPMTAAKAGASKPRSTQNGSRSGAVATTAKTPATRGPQPRPPRLTAVATPVAKAFRPGGARSTRVAVPVPVKMPADRPDSARPASRAPSPPASRNATALAADKVSPASRAGLRPIWSDSPPRNSSAAITPIP